jgi:hypothetical protein
MEKQPSKPIFEKLDLEKFEEILHIFEENKDKPMRGDLPEDFEEKIEKIEAQIEEYRKICEGAIANANALIKEITGKEVGPRDIEEIASHPESVFGKKDAAALKQITKLKEKFSELESDFEMKRRLINERARQEGKEAEGKGKKEKNKGAKKLAKRKNWRSI